MKRIPLRARDGSVRAYAVVDDEDFEYLDQWRWSLNPATGYPVRMVSMQRELAERLGFGDAELIHHDDEDKLNFRRDNLKPTTRAAHNAHHNSKPGNRIRQTKGGRWFAWRNVNGRQVKIGTFDTPEAAREAPIPS